MNALNSCDCWYSTQWKRKAWGMLGFLRTSRSRGRGVAVGRSSTNSSATARAGLSVEGAFCHARETAQQQQQVRTTADVTGAARPSSLRGPRPMSIQRSPTIDEICPESDDTPATAAAAATGLCKDRAVQTSDELLQPLISEGLRQRRRPAGEIDASPTVDKEGGSADDLLGGACPPWRRHSLSSMSPLSPRLASPVDDLYQMPPRPLPAVPPGGDLILDDMLGDLGGVDSPRSLSPLSITEMSIGH